MIYPIRAHHGMCFAFFQGKGYSGKFTENMQTMKEKLEQNPQIILLCGVDEVCAHCPNRQGEQCASGKPVLYDRQVLAYCGLAEGTQMPWNDFSEAVRTHILAPGKREEICGGCEWSGLCR